MRNLLLYLVFSVLLTVAHAQVFTWTGNDGNQWRDSGNWSPSSDYPELADETAHFDGSTVSAGNQTVNANSGSDPSSNFFLKNLEITTNDSNDNWTLNDGARPAGIIFSGDAFSGLGSFTSRLNGGGNASISLDFYIDPFFPLPWHAEGNLLNFSGKILPESSSVLAPTIIGSSTSSGGVNLASATDFPGRWLTGTMSIRLGVREALEKARVDLTDTQNRLTYINEARLGALTGSGPLTLTETLRVGSDTQNDFTYDGVLSGAGDFIKIGSNTMTLSTAATHTGITGVEAGTLIIENAASLTASEIQVDGGTMDLSQTTGGIVTGNLAGSGGTLQLGGNDLTFEQDSQKTLNTNIIGTGSTVTKNGIRPITFTGSLSNSYEMTVNVGQLIVEGNALSGNAVQLSENTAFVVQDGPATVGGLSGEGTIDTLGESLRIDSADDFTFDGQLQGQTTGSYEKRGAGDWHLTRETLNASGQLILQGGSLSISAATTTEDFSRIFMSGGVLRIRESMSYNHPIVVSFSSSPRFIVDADKTFTLTRNISYQGSGTQTLIKDGGGTLKLINSTSDEVNLQVNEGTVLVNNSTGSATGSGGATVVAGAHFGGSGRINGSLNAASGSTISPGDEVGTLHIGGGSLAGELKIQVDGASSDRLVSSAPLDITGATLDLSNTGFGFTESSYTIVTATGGLTGTFSAITSPIGFSIQYTTNSVVITLGADLLSMNSATTFDTGESNTVGFTLGFTSPIQGLLASDLAIDMPGAFAEVQSIESLGDGSTYNVIVRTRGSGALTVGISENNTILSTDGNGLASSLDPLEETITAIPIIFVATTGSNTPPYDSWATASTNLRTALSYTPPGNTSPSQPKEIWVAEGSYNPGVNRSNSFVVQSNTELYGGFTTSMNFRSERNPDPRTNSTILTGDVNGDDTPNFGNRNDNTHHILVSTSNSNATIIDGFQVRASNVTGSSTLYGGGLFLSGSTNFRRPTIRNCWFTDHSATASTAYGTAIWIERIDPQLENCIVSGNRSPRWAPIYIEESVTGVTSPIFINTLITGNTGAIGAIACREDAQLTLLNCTITGNHSEGNTTFQFQDREQIIQNTIIWGNSQTNTDPDNLSFLDTQSTGALFTNSLVEGYSAAELDAYGSGGSGNLDEADPSFVNAVSATSGSPTSTGDFQLLPGSVAIEAGDSALNTTALDLGQSARIKLTGIDLGAFEMGAPVTITSLTAITPSPTNSTSAEFEVVFSAPISGFDSLDDLDLITFGTLTVGGVQITSTDQATFSLTLTGVSGDGSLILSIDLDSDIRPVAGSTLLTGSSPQVAGYIVDQTPPELTIVASGPTPTNISPLNYAAIFTEEVQNVTNDDFSIFAANGITVIQNTPDIYFVNADVIGRVSANRPLILAGGNDITDLAGNPVSNFPNAAIFYDGTAPVITLAGESSIVLEADASYSDAGATATDDVDASVSVQVTGLDALDTSVPGIYPISYDATDSVGNAAETAVRTVRVTNSISITADQAFTDDELATGVDLTGTSDLPRGSVVKVELSDGSVSQTSYAVVDDNGAWSVHLSQSDLTNELPLLSQTVKMRNPRLAQLAGGGWVVAWFTTVTPATENSVYYQRYAADGAKLGDIVKVDTFDDGVNGAANDGDVRVAAISDGGWILTWTRAGATGDGTDQEILYQRYASDGSPVGGNVKVDEADSTDDQQPSVSALGTGGWVISWISTGQDLGDGVGNEVAMQLYAADGTLIGGNVKADAPDGNRTDLVTDLASAPDGGFILSWQGWNTVDGNWDSFFKRFDAQGVEQVSDVSLDLSLGSTDTGVGPQAAVLKDGSNVGTFRTGSDTFYVLFDDQETVRALGQVNPATPQVTYPHGITALETGGFLITWTSGPSSNVGTWEIYQRVYDANGSPLGGPVPVNTPDSAVDGRPDVIGLPDGGWLIAWEAGSNLGFQRFSREGVAIPSSVSLQGFSNGVVDLTVSTVDSFGTTITTTGTADLNPAAPQLVSITDSYPDNETNAPSLNFTVTFSEPVINFTEADLDIYTEGSLTILQRTVSPQSPGVYAVSLSVEGEGFLDLGLEGSDITDLFGNALVTNDILNDFIFRFETSSTNHYVDASNANPSAPFTTWETAASTLQDALEYAVAGDTIHITQGIYKPDQGRSVFEDDRGAVFIIKDGVTITGSYPSGGSGSPDLDSTPTILSGDLGVVDDASDNSYHVLLHQGSAAPTKIENLVIEDGNANGDFFDSQAGGLLVTAPGLLTIENCEFRDNAAIDGGAFTFEGGQILFIDTIFTNNTAINEGGACFLPEGMPVFEGCVFASNKAQDDGGAVSIQSAQVIFEACLFSQNDATEEGGAIYLSSALPTLPPTRGLGSYTATHSLFEGNGSGDTGGTIGIKGGTGSATNSIFVGSYSDLGGIFLLDDAAVQTVTSCSLVGAEATLGGLCSLDGDSNIAFANSVVWDIETTNGDSIRHADALSSVTWDSCLVEGQSAADLNASGANNIDSKDPRFLVLPSKGESAWSTVADNDYGNLAFTYDSPLRDAGDSTLTPDAANGADFLGFDRLQASNIDIGALEHPVLTPYQTWTLAKGLSVGTNAAFTDNPDGDAWTNGQEFAFAGNPLLRDSFEIRHTDIFNQNGTNYYVLTIPVRSTAVFTGTPLTATIEGITYTIEGSRDLADFTEQVTLTTSPAGLPPLDSEWTYRSFRLVSDNEEAGFIRIGIIPTSQ